MLSPEASRLSGFHCIISLVSIIMDGNVGSDPRRPQKVKTYDFVKDPPEGITSSDLLSFMGLILSVIGLLFKVSTPSELVSLTSQTTEFSLIFRLFGNSMYLFVLIA